MPEAMNDSQRPLPADAGFSRAQDLAAFRAMLLIRRFEEKVGQLYGMGLIGGYCHLYRETRFA